MLYLSVRILKIKPPKMCRWHNFHLGCLDKIDFFIADGATVIE